MTAASAEEVGAVALRTARRRGRAGAAL
ncbi:hypothetical protein STRTUCAR8_03915, partial [Streptomyces turgidiscabies Car8]